LPLSEDLLFCAKHLFFAARIVRHGLQVIMRRAHLALGGRNQGTDQVGDVLYSIGLAAIRRVQQAGRSIQAGAPIMALTATASVVFRLRYDFGIGRRDQAASAGRIDG
jgi:hypothetical protein